MCSPEKSIKILIILLKLAVFSLFLGSLAFIFVGQFWGTAILVLAGLTFLFLTQGLSERKKWAWYSALITSFINLALGLVLFVLDWVNLIALVFGSLFAIAYLILLFGCAKIFLEQPKEKISDWFSDARFSFVVGTSLLFLLVIIGGSLYFNWWIPQQIEAEKEELSQRVLIPLEILKPEQIENQTKEWKTYKAEQTGFSIEHHEELEVTMDETFERFTTILSDPKFVTLERLRATILDMPDFKITILKGRLDLEKISDFEELINLREDNLKKYEYKYLKEEIILDSIPGIRFALFYFKNVRSEIYLQKGEYVYLIKTEFPYSKQSEYSLFSNQIFSTFKFLEVNKKYCEEDYDCDCGIDVETEECFVGNKIYVDPYFKNFTVKCPDFCHGISGREFTRCINNQCKKIYISAE